MSEDAVKINQEVRTDKVSMPQMWYRFCFFVKRWNLFYHNFVFYQLIEHFFLLLQFETQATIFFFFFFFFAMFVFIFIFFYKYR